MECCKCHQQIPDGSKFCMHCGSKQAVDYIVCPKCGYKNPLDARFCTDCGSILLQSSEVNHELNDIWDMIKLPTGYFVEEISYNKDNHELVLQISSNYIFSILIRVYAVNNVVISTLFPFYKDEFHIYDNKITITRCVWKGNLSQIKSIECKRA